MKSVICAIGSLLAAASFAAGELPAGYTAVEYLVAPRDSYIDTDYKPNQSTRVVMDVTVKGEFEYWFGCWTNSYNRGAFALGNDGDYGIYFAVCDDGGSFFHDGERVSVGRHAVELTPWEFKVDDTIWAAKAELSRKDFQLDQPLYLFAQNRKGSAFVNLAQGDIFCHGCSIYDNGVVVRDFVPCFRNSDGAIGLYDLAESDPTKAFYANAGKGAFGVSDGSLCTVTIGDYPHMTAAWTFGDGSKTNAVSGTSFEVLKGMSGVKVIFTAKRNYVIDGDPVVELDGAVTENVVFGEGNDYAVPMVRSAFGDIAYLDWDDTNGKMTNATLSATDYELVTADTTAFSTGQWYVVADTVVIDNGNNIKVNGSAHLVLCDNASLTIRNVASEKAAIDVSASATNALTIYGQTAGTGALEATGGYRGAGIGGGYQGAGGTITVNGGMVTATGGSEGAGIGGGWYGAGGTITVNGGMVTANGGYNGAGIGGGCRRAGGIVTVNGGEVAATGGSEGAGIGGGYKGADGKVTLGDNVVVLEGMYGNGSSYVKIVNTDEYPLVTVGAFEHMTATWTSGDGAVTNAISGTSFRVKTGTTNVKVIFTAKRNYVIDGDPVVELNGAVTENVVFGEGNDYTVPTAVCTLDAIPYLDWDDVEKKMTNATLPVADYELVTADTTMFSTGKWYVVADDVVIDNGANIKVNGTAHLILCDNASLTITNVGNNKAAIDVSVSGSVTNALTIYGQPGGSGVLSATGGQYGAGIGGGRDGAGGTVTVNGGTVTATGDDYGAGIGGGFHCTGGTVTINGGTVTANGGRYAAGIGGGWYGAGGMVTINGEIVTAQGGDYGSGIGGGDSGADGTVTRGESVIVVEGAVGNGSSYVKILNTDNYPIVTVGVFEHMTAAWTSGDGTVTNPVRGTFFWVKKGTEDVKVIFTADAGYFFTGGAFVAEVPVGRVEKDYQVSAPELEKSEVETFGWGWYVTAPCGAYINTLFQPGSNTRVEMDVLVGNTLKREYWFGCWTNDWNNGAFALGNDGAEVYRGYGSGDFCGGVKGLGAIPSGRVTVALEKGIVYTNGVAWSVEPRSDEVFALNRDLYLFAQNRAGTAKPGDGQERIVCYGCRIWTNGVNGAAVPVRNFVPARTKDERLVVGLYDTVSGEFFAPRGDALALGYDEDAAVPVTPGVPVVCDTAEEATNFAMRAELTPSAEVAAALGSDEERQKYRNMFEFGVVPAEDGKWAVEAFLKEPDWTNVVKSAQAATRQIPVADLAALELGDPTNVTVEGCVPGFYYSIYGGTALTNIKMFVSEESRNVLCKPETPVTFKEIVKPSDASGYFIIGVLEVPIVYVPGTDYTITGGVVDPFGPRHTGK